MTRLIVSLRDETTINIPADAIDIREGWIMAWRGDFVVAMVKEDEVKLCYLSEQKS